MKKNHLFSIFIFLILAGFSHSSNAKSVKDDKYMCEPLYMNVDRVFFTYEEKIPNTVDWDQVTNKIQKKYGRIYSKGNIPFEYTEKSAEEIIDKFKNALHIKIVYSYVEGTSFSINLGTEQLAVWVEVRGYNDGNNSGVQIGALPKFIKNPVVRLTSSHARMMEYTACSVIEFSSDTKCSNKMQYPIREFEPVTEQCIPQHKDDIFEDYLNSINEK